MLKDFGIAEPHKVIVPQGRASFEAMGSNSPVASGSCGNSGQFSSAFLLAAPLDAPDSLQAENRNADATRTAQETLIEKSFIQNNIDKLFRKIVFPSLSREQRSLLQAQCNSYCCGKKMVMPGHARHDNCEKWLAMAEDARHDSRREQSATAGQGLDRRNCGWVLSSRAHPGNNGYGKPT